MRDGPDPFRGGRQHTFRFEIPRLCSPTRLLSPRQRDLPLRPWFVVATLNASQGLSQKYRLDTGMTHVKVYGEDLTFAFKQWSVQACAVHVTLSAPVVAGG